MEFRDTRATPSDFALGVTVAAAILAVLFGLVSFSENLVRAVY